MAAITLANLISYVAQSYGQAYASGTGDSGTNTTTVVDDALIANGYSLIGHQILLGASSTPRRISDFDDTTGTVTYTPIASGITTGSAYEILPLPRAEFVAAIQKAMRAAGRDFPTVRYATLELSAGQQDYDLAADVAVLVAAWISSYPTGSNITSWKPFHEYEMLAAEGLRRIQLRRIMLANYVGYTHTLRYSYYALPERLTTDSQVLQAGEGTGSYPSDDQQLIAFIEEMALHYLHERALQLSPTGQEARVHATMSGNHLKKAEDIRRRSATAPRVTRYVRRPRLVNHI